MEFVGQPKASGACNLLGVPGLSSLDVDDDECDVVIGIRPKSSPLPRRRSSTSDEDSELEPPLLGSRRVSFADAKGLSLVQVKEFETWDVPKLPVCDPSEVKGKVAEEYFLSPLTFSLPLPTEELFVKVREQKVELETIELIPGTTILKGVIRVLNISFTKAVYIRATLDTWSSHFDLLAEYMPGSSDSLMDLFSFKLTLVPPFGEQGARVDFCLRYETPQGTFWANNNGRNYVLFCHQRVKERKEKPQKENVNKKSCLKTFSQNVSSVENTSTMGASTQENISTVVLKQGGVADTMKDKQISEDQSGTSEDRQKLLAESRQNCSRRSRRKAARIARVRDYFSQRDGGADDTKRDELPPEAKQAAQKETPEEKHPDVRSFNEGSRKSEGSESVETCSKPLLDALHDTSPAHDYTSNSETAKSESVNLADSATLTGGESATDIPHNPSNDEPAPAENINKSKAEESSAAAEPAESVTSAVNSLVSQTNSFTFGTVVAPLYHQVFGRVGSESQSVGDWGNPVLNIADLTQSYPYTERRQTSCPFPRDARGNDEEVQGNVTKTQESNQEFLDATPNSPTKEKEEETSLSMTANNILDHAETLQDPVDIILSDQSRTDTSKAPNTLSEDTVHPHALQIPNESLHLQGEAQENNLSNDVQLPEHTCTQTNLDETTAESDDMPSLEPSLMPLEPSQSVSECVSDKTDQQTSHSGANDFKCVHESDKGNAIGKTVTLPTTNELSEEDKLFETYNVEEGYNAANYSHKSEAKHSAETKVIGEVAESTTEASISNHVHSDVFDELKDEDIQEKNHHEMEAALSKQEDFCLADTTEVNWEMMVEEEEKNILTDEEECEAVSVTTVEKDQGQLDNTGIELEDAGMATASENRDTTEVEKEETEKESVEITAEREKENKAEDADVSEDKQRIGENDISEILSEKDREQWPYIQATKAAGEEELPEETEEEKRQEQEETELEEEKHFAVIPEINIKKKNVQDEEEIEEEEEMEINLNDDYEADVEWEDQVKPREENVQDENPDYNEEILVDDRGESEIADAESESMTIEDGENEAGCFEERLDITQNKIEDGLSAPVNNVQDKRIIDKENTGEGQNGHILTNMHLYKKEDFQSNENVTHDLSRAERDENDSAAAEGGSWIFTDEPESDQEGHGSASPESDSDDEVELYMHCLRAVHAGAQAQKDRNKDTGFNVSKRPSISRGKLLPTPMPSISESLDEEQHFSCLPDNHEDMETAEIQLTATASSGQKSVDRNVAWWKETFSCSNISKALLYATLLVVFFVVAHRYDFLACFGLYLVSLIWLYCQGDKQPEQQKQQNKLN